MSPAAVRAPSLTQIKAFMRHSGWNEQPPGAAGSLWTKNQLRIGMPFASDGDREAARGVIRRLATYEGQSESDLSARVRYHRMDVAYLRAANDYRITDTIPLEAAATLIGSTRKLLRSSGTTAWRERSEIGGNYAARGDDVLRSARMDHTIEGSFVIPVLVPLSEPEDRMSATPAIDNLELFVSTPEPFERRVTRTLAQSVQAVREIVVQPEQSPTNADLHDLVQQGVSREFCSALASILAEPAIGEFETRFDWAEAIPAPSTMPSSVVIEGDAAEKVSDTAERLRRARIDTSSTFSGDIVELRHLTDDPIGHIWVSTIRRGRRSEIRVQLPFLQYQEAVAWHQAQRAVIVEGQVNLGPARRLVVDNPVSCRPLDEIFLPAS